MAVHPPGLAGARGLTLVAESCTYPKNDVRSSLYIALIRAGVEAVIYVTNHIKLFKSMLAAYLR
jgi:hypothetical protein